MLPWAACSVKTGQAVLPYRMSPRHPTPVWQGAKRRARISGWPLHPMAIRAFDRAAAEAAKRMGADHQALRPGTSGVDREALRALPRTLQPTPCSMRALPTHFPTYRSATSSVFGCSTAWRTEERPVVGGFSFEVQRWLMNRSLRLSVNATKCVAFTPGARAYSVKRARQGQALRAAFGRP
jgi:hypothetical protein